jgi:hypothetical protein
MYTYIETVAGHAVPNIFKFAYCSVPIHQGFERLLNVVTCHVRNILHCDVKLEFYLHKLYNIVTKCVLGESLHFISPDVHLFAVINLNSAFP